MSWHGESFQFVVEIQIRACDFRRSEHWLDCMAKYAMNSFCINTTTSHSKVHQIYMRMFTEMDVVANENERNPIVYYD